MTNEEKWIKEYIENIDLKNIEWIKLNSTELNEFFKKNYLDKGLCEYVCNKVDNLYPTPLGMHYLNFCSPINFPQCSFLLGVVDNIVGKKTIVCSITYFDEYFTFADQIEPLTYISTIEVNSFFRNQGLCKRIFEIFFDFINPNQYILTSQLSLLGRECKVYDILIKSAIKKGFEKSISKDNHNLGNSQLRAMICYKSKTLKKKIYNKKD